MPKLGYALVALCLTACSETPVALEPLVDYQQRVANTLDRDAIDYVPTTYPQLPDVRTLRTEVARVSVSLLDSWRLDQCAAGQLLAQRNSALGKLEEGISRYFTDRQLTTALNACTAELERAGDLQLAARLRQALNAKQQTLPASKQQAIATDDALRHTLRVAPNSLSKADDEAFAAALSALDQVLAVLAEPVNTPSGLSRVALDDALQRLHQSDYLPRLWRTLHSFSSYLEQLTPLVATLAADAGCSSKGRPQRAEVLYTVFLKFFIQQTQVQLAGFTRQGYLVNERLQRLQNISNQPQLQDYLQQLQELTNRVNLRSKQHVEPWQAFFTACGFRPG